MEKELKDDRVIFCRRCGRKLVGSHSKELGFGPMCYKLWKRERNQQLRLFNKEESQSE